MNFPLRQVRLSRQTATLLRLEQPRDISQIRQLLSAISASYAHSAYGLQRQGICALRRLGDALPRIPTIPVVPTGFTELDALLTIGGVPRGGLTELLIPIRVPTYNFAGG
jgi:hypothetical protein